MRTHQIVPLLVLCLFADSARGRAQNAPPYATSSREMEATLRRVEGALNRIEKGRVIDTTADDVDNQLEAYSRAARNAFDQVLAEMRHYSDSKGAGNLAVVQQFERQVRGHRDRIDNVISRMSRIDGAIRTGRIQIAPELIRGMNDNDRKEFLQSLTPSTDSAYRRRVPELRTAQVQHMTDEEWRLASSACRRGAELSRTSVAFKPKLAEELRLPGLLDLLIPSAYASTPVRTPGLGLACYGICSASLGAGCLQCIVGAGGTALAAWNQMSSCKSNCGTCRWYKPWRCACRAVCTAAFLATIA